MPRQSVNVPLTEPIRAHGEVVSSVTIRPLTAKDIRQFGDPRVFSVDGLTFHFNTAIIAALLAAAGNIPPSSVDQMDPADFDACGKAVVDFFLPQTKPETS